MSIMSKSILLYSVFLFYPMNLSITALIRFVPGILTHHHNRESIAWPKDKIQICKIHKQTNSHLAIYWFSQQLDLCDSVLFCMTLYDSLWLFLTLYDSVVMWLCNQTMAMAMAMCCDYVTKLWLWLWLCVVMWLCNQTALCVIKLCLCWP